MACSDNVVRAGLTPKFKDKKTLCDMLTYNARPAEDNLFKPVNHPTSPSVMVCPCGTALLATVAIVSTMYIRVAAVTVYC